MVLGNLCTPNMCVSGIILASKPHWDDRSRILYYLCAQSFEFRVSKDSSHSTEDHNGGSHLTTTSAAAEKRRKQNDPPHSGEEWEEDNNEEEGLQWEQVKAGRLASPDGYYYDPSGWYDAENLTKLTDEGAGGSGAVAITAKHRLEMRRPCELQYLCFQFSPWFEAPFDTLGYLPQPDAGYVHSVYLCHRCLAPFFDRSVFQEHLFGGLCSLSGQRHPGTKLYEAEIAPKGSKVRVYLVDGGQDVSFCRHITLLGRCFVESKLLQHDTDIMEYLVVTVSGPAIWEGDEELGGVLKDFDRPAVDEEGKPLGGWMGECLVAFSSKVKHLPCSVLSTITTMPYFTRRGAASLLLDVAYALCEARQRQCGCERFCGSPSVGGSISRPLSVFGEAMLLSYWKRHILRAMAAIILQDQTVAAHPTSGSGSSAAGGGGSFTTMTQKRLLDQLHRHSIPIHAEDLFFAMDKLELLSTSRAEDAVYIVLTGPMLAEVERQMQSLQQQRNATSLKEPAFHGDEHHQHPICFDIDSLQFLSHVCGGSQASSRKPQLPQYLVHYDE